MSDKESEFQHFQSLDLRMYFRTAWIHYKNTMPRSSCISFPGRWNYSGWFQIHGIFNSTYKVHLTADRVD